MNNNQKNDSIYNSYQTNNQSLNKQVNEPYRTENVTVGKRISRVVMMISLVAIIVLVGGFALVYTGVIKVGHIGPQSILLNASNIGVKKGKDYQYDYQVYPETSTAKNVYYESSDPSVAEVNRTTGYVTPIKEGTTTISIKSTDDDTVIEKSNLSVTKEKVAINEIKLSSERIVFDLSNKSKSQLLKVFTEPYNATNQELSFESSDTSVAIVDQSGRVYPVGFGMATIVVRAKDGSASATCEVIVTDSKNKKVYFELPDKSKLVFPYSIELETNYLKLRYGTTRKVGFILLPPDVTEDVVTWISSDPNVATVKDGLVEGVAVGHTTITARTVNDLVATLTVDVTDEETTSSYVEFRDDTDEIEVGETKRLTVSYDPNASVANFDFTSSNPDVISVDSEGNVTALAKGSATITVKPGSTSGVAPMASKNGDTIVIIADGIETPNYITVTESSITIGTGETRQLAVESDTGNDNFTYQSLNEEVATVSEDGAIYGVSVGTAEIKISAANGVSTTVTVNVTNVEASNIVISEASGTTIKKGNTLDLTAEIWPKNATETKITWTSSNPNVATVNENGTVKAVAIGQTTITAVVGTQSNSIVIKVAAEEVDNSNLKPSKTLSDVQIEQLKKTPIIFERESNTKVKMTLDLEGQGYTDYINISKTTFKISTKDATIKDSKIKDVSKKMPLSKYLTFASGSYGNISITATVYLKEGSKKEITLEPASYKIGEDITVEFSIPVGSIVSLGSYFTVGEASKVTDWTNTNSEVAKISDGNIEGLKEGTTYITGHSNGYTFIGTVKVVDDTSEEETDSKNFTFLFDACYAASDLCQSGTLVTTSLPKNTSKCTKEKPYYVAKQKTNYEFTCKVDKKKTTYSGLSTYTVIDKELTFDHTTGSNISKGETQTIKISNWNKLNLKSATVKTSVDSTSKSVSNGSFKVTAPQKTDAKSITITVEGKTSGSAPKVYKGVLVLNISEEFVPGSIECETGNKLTIVEGKEKTLSCFLIDKYDPTIKQQITSNDNPTYSTSNKKIVTVDGEGKIVAVKANKNAATITVGARNLKAKVKVTVTEAPPVYTYLGITLKKGKNATTKVSLGDNDLTLAYSIGLTKDSKKKITSGLEVNYTSSNPDVLSIEENKVTPVSAGNATITGTYINTNGDEIKGTLDITVTEHDPVISDLTCGDLTLTLAGDDEANHSGIINCNATDSANNRSFTVYEKPTMFTYKVTGSKIVTIDSATGTITATKAGTTKVRVTILGKSKDITITVLSGKATYTDLKITNLDGVELKLDSTDPKDKTIDVQYELTTESGTKITNSSAVKISVDKNSKEKVKISGNTITAKETGNVTVKVSYDNPKGSKDLKDSKTIRIYKDKTCYSYKKSSKVYEACKDGYANAGSTESICYKIIEDATTEKECMKDVNAGTNRGLRVWSNGVCLSQVASDTYYPKYSEEVSEYAYLPTEKTYKGYTYDKKVTCRGACNVTNCTPKTSNNNDVDLDAEEPIEDGE